MYDAVIVGGGIVGISAAYNLVRAGAKILVVDRLDAGRATNAGAGILSPQTNSRDGEAWFNFGLKAVNYYDTLLAQLAEDQAGETGYARCGKITVAVSDDEIDSFKQARAVILARQSRLGQPGKDALYELSSDEAQARFPALAPVQGAIYYRDAARVDGRLLAGAIQRAAEKQGLEIRNATVDQLIIEDGQTIGVRIDEETIGAGAVVIAGGAWSQNFAAQLNVQIPVEPQRGQIIHLDLPETETNIWPIITAFHGHYIVPWDDQRVVVGATREVGSGFGVHTTVVGVREVLDEALRVAPGLRDASIREIRVGLRPATPDLLPVLGTVPHITRVYLATGHGPTGLQLGPYSGKLMADMILDKLVETDIAAFSITRFL